MSTVSRAVFTSDGPMIITQSVSRTGSMSVPSMKSSHWGTPRSRYPIRAPTGWLRMTSAFTTSLTRITSARTDAAPTIASGFAPPRRAGLGASERRCAVPLVGPALRGIAERCVGRCVRGARVATRNRRNGRLPIAPVRSLRRPREAGSGSSAGGGGDGGSSAAITLDRDRGFSLDVLHFEAVRHVERNGRGVEDGGSDRAQSEHDSNPTARPEAFGPAPGPAVERWRRVGGRGRRLRRPFAKRAPPELKLWTQWTRRPYVSLADA